MVYVFQGFQGFQIFGRLICLVSCWTYLRISGVEGREGRDGLKEGRGAKILDHETILFFFANCSSFFMMGC